MGKPRVCVLRTDGTNCDGETAYAFAKAGGIPEPVHVNQLRGGARHLRDYQILAIPGGFSYGDDVASGKVLAVELMSMLSDQLSEFVERGKLVIGICNGFQVLVRTGLLPFRTMGRMQATLTHNASGRFECRWVDLTAEPGPCVFTLGIERDLSLPIAHGEGRFWADAGELAQIEQGNLVALRYDERTNPNGSLNRIAGVCDKTGRIFGLMPHPERFVEATHHPNWRRHPGLEPQGLPIFMRAVAAAGEL